MNLYRELLEAVDLCRTAPDEAAAEIALAQADAIADNMSQSNR